VAPVGPKLMVVDDELVPLLDIRELIVEGPADLQEGD